MLGAVGAYDWNGTVVMQKANQIVIPQNTTFQTEPTKMNEPLASYLGKTWMQPQEASSREMFTLFSPVSMILNHVIRLP